MGGALREHDGNDLVIRGQSVSLREWRYIVFFFQAEDGIRDLTVTGVQTCALPISMRGDQDRRRIRTAPAFAQVVIVEGANIPDGRESFRPRSHPRMGRRRASSGREIGRASCRERV